jgi:wyosine [tRNA(Phe)-imidazoG37] synthetase (radical SAM superfamily)
MTIPLQSGIIYGPVNSRRLGRSLGVNIVSTKIKICMFNCVYCQYGLSRVGEEYMSDIRWYPSPREITAALENILPILDPKPAFITFSGNGEATLHPEFSSLIDQIKKIRYTHAPNAAVAILSNSSTITKIEIREAIQRLDKRIMKLDCGNEDTFKRYNQPMQNLRLQDIVEGLKQVKDVTIQALFSDGVGGNYTGDNITDWVTKIKEIKPTSVQIYSLDRSYPSALISPLSIAELNKIKNLLDIENIRSEVFSR